jgi:hypothetical protein
MTTIHLSVPGAWEQVRETRRHLESVLRHLPNEARASIAMAASELIENAIKYGTEVPNCREVQLHVAVSDETLSVEVSNGVRDDGFVSELAAHIDRITRADDGENLYLSRLLELVNDPSATGKLGLYRIGYEGRFDLAYEHKNEVLTVRATRGVTS